MCVYARAYMRVYIRTSSAHAVALFNSPVLMCVCVYVCMCVWVYVCVCARVYVRVYTNLLSTRNSTIQLSRADVFLSFKQQHVRVYCV